MMINSVMCSNIIVIIILIWRVLFKEIKAVVTAVCLNLYFVQPLFCEKMYSKFYNCFHKNLRY